MRIENLKFAVEQQGRTPLKSFLVVEAAKDLEGLKEAGLPAVYLIRNEDISQLKQFEDAVIFRGIKNKHKGLTKYLLGLVDDRIPVIDGNYDSPGQVKRSVRSLLDNAAEKEERKYYIIGVEEDVFRKLWSVAKEDVHDLRMKRAKKSEGAGPSCGDPKEQVLYELMGSVDVPENLCGKFIGSSHEVQFVRILISLAAKRTEPVLVVGDTGTGKEVVAREIHHYSKRSNGKFIPVNCGGIPSELLESELFGHKKDAFTGATRDKEGLWKIAENGTLFLDEIGDLSLHHQVKILRALDDRKIRPVGGNEEIPVNARVVAATNRDILSMVRKGRFREDLYYRLRGFLIPTPPLRSHPEDIPAIAEHFWQGIVGDRNKRLPREILKELALRNWPGNARELKMMLNHLYALFPDVRPESRHLAFIFQYEGRDYFSIEDHLKDEVGNGRHRAECYQRLRKVDEVIHAIEFTVAPYLKKKAVDTPEASVAKASLECSLTELELLCRESLLFHSEYAYSAVVRLKEKIAHFLDLMDVDMDAATQYLKETLQTEFRPVMSLLFKEVEQILRD